LAAELALTAFHMALATRQVQPGLVHHSDRDASQVYTNVLKAHGIQISIGRAGNLYNNAQAERFFKILKYSELISKLTLRWG
jgi:putative transposase